MPTWTSWSARAGTRWAATRTDPDRRAARGVHKVTSAPSTTLVRADRATGRIEAVHDESVSLKRVTVPAACQVR